MAISLQPEFFCCKFYPRTLFSFFFYGTNFIRVATSTPTALCRAISVKILHETAIHIGVVLPKTAVHSRFKVEIAARKKLVRTKNEIKVYG